MEVTSFKLNKNTTLTRADLNESTGVITDNVSAAGLAFFPVQPPWQPAGPTYINLSTNIAFQNWYETEGTPMGTFDTVSGEGFTSSPCIITPPMQLGGIDIVLLTLKGGLLVNYDAATTIPSDISDWGCCISFQPMNGHIRSYYGILGSPHLPLVPAVYHTETPLPPIIELNNFLAGLSSTGVTNCWDQVVKAPYNDNYWLNFVGPYLSNSGADTNLICEWYTDITDPTAANPNTAFAGLTPVYTSIEVTVAAGLSNELVVFENIEDNTGVGDLWYWLKAPPGGSVGSITVHADFDPAGTGGSGNIKGTMNKRVYGQAAYVS